MVVAELVLITGGAGFIGSALAAALRARGDAVRVLDNFSEQIHADAGREDAETIAGSVLDTETLERALAGVDVVVHFAAETGTGQSMYEVARYADVNVGGTARLLEAIARQSTRPRKLVVASSRAVYGEGKYLDHEGRAVYPPTRAVADLEQGRFDPRDNGRPLQAVATDEDSALHPVSVYGVTKLSQEQLVLAVAQSIGVSATALRYQNVYGPGQSLRNPYTGILSIFSTLIRQGSPINIFEDGLESRDFVYIDDVVDATIRALPSDAADGLAVNVGSGVATTVLDVVRGLERALGATAQITVTGDFRLGDIRHNFADLTRARELLGFTPATSLADGLQRFTQWALDQEQPDSNYEGSLAELRLRGLLK